MREDSKSVTITINHQIYSLTRKDVSEKMVDVKPKRFVKYYIELWDKKYPIKQVVSKTLGIPLPTFTTNHAYKALDDLGFPILEK